MGQIPAPPPRRPEEIGGSSDFRSRRPEKPTGIGPSGNYLKLDAVVYAKQIFDIPLLTDRAAVCICGTEPRLLIDSDCEQCGD